MMAAKLLVIGASAGGFQALRELLPLVPSIAGMAVVIVLHLHPQSQMDPADFFCLSDWSACREARDKEPILERIIYFAPPGYHLLVERERTFSLSVDDPVQWARPSVDVLFESAADAYGPDAVAIILTGANQDGARGCAYLAARGGTVYVQAPEEAEVSSMPRAALLLCPQAQALNLLELGRSVQRLMKARER